jgi:hypothetical protein
MSIGRESGRRAASGDFILFSPWEAKDWLSVSALAVGIRPMGL